MELKILFVGVGFGVNNLLPLLVLGIRMLLWKVYRLTKSFQVTGVKYNRHYQFSPYKCNTLTPLIQTYRVKSYALCLTLFTYHVKILTQKSAQYNNACDLYCYCDLFLIIKVSS